MNDSFEAPAPLADLVRTQKVLLLIFVILGLASVFASSASAYQYAVATLLGIESGIVLRRSRHNTVLHLAMAGVNGVAMVMLGHDLSVATFAQLVSLFGISATISFMLGIRRACRVSPELSSNSR